jgi:prolyl-tRNA editing enzyme YbaK/EbsC (Cys-tRNA(Pro) deacylase)
VIELPESTRTAKEAADAVGCQVGQIAKCILLRTQHSNRPQLVIASGVNRIDFKKIAEICEEAVEQGKSDFVRDATGCVIGGVPPISHTQSISTFIDIDLMQFSEIWAAAGTPRAVFHLSPKQLRQITDGKVIQLAETG